jgi:hypothetical protein
MRPRLPFRAAGHASIAILATALALLPLPAAGQAPDRIDLPGGWRPEGIASLDGMLYVGSLADGAVWRVDASTGVGSVLVPGVAGSVAVGVEVDPADGRLWVAGGQTGEVRAYELSTGEPLATYTFEAGFINDLAATPDGVVATDSFMPQLLVIPYGEDGGLPGRSETRALRIRGDLQYAEGQLNANGIVAAPGWLVVVTTHDGGLYRIDPASGRAFRIEAGTADLTFGDGLELDGRTLYVVRNQAGRVAVLELGPWLASATQVAELTSDDLDVPTTAALIGDDLWAVSARFGTDPAPETEYWVTRLDAAP